MREYFLGALGVALAYPVLWYQLELEPTGDARAAVAPRAVSATAPRGKPGAAADASELTGPGAEPALRRGRPSAEKTRRPLGLEPEVAVSEREGSGGRPLVKQPKAPEVRTPNMPVLPLPEALPKTIDQMSELQRLAHDPMRLAERVQGLESNAAELEELKAFAEKFVTLPPERVDPSIMRPSGRPERSRSRWPDQR